MDFYCCLQFTSDADLYLVRRPMIGQTKRYWTAYLFHQVSKYLNYLWHLLKLAQLYPSVKYLC